MRGIIPQLFAQSLVGASFAQQDPQFTQYMFDRIVHQPCGRRYFGSACVPPLCCASNGAGSMVHRRRHCFNYPMPINRISSGVGLSFYLDELGKQKTTFAKLHYSFHRKIGAGHLWYRPLLRHDSAHPWVTIGSLVNDVLPWMKRYQRPGPMISVLTWVQDCTMWQPTFWLGISAVPI
jgi:hypothetical protein